MPAGAGALPQTFNFSDPIPNLPSPFDTKIATTRATFDFDTPGNLKITLEYVEFDGGNTLQTVGQTLTGITFDIDGSIAVDLNASTAFLGVNSIFVGSAASVATNQLGNDVSSHWGYVMNAALGNVMGQGQMLGTHLVGSVGDAGVTKDPGGNVISGVEGVLGNMDLFDNNPSTVEPNPPDGTPFSLVDGDTCNALNCGGLAEGFGMNAAWIQSALVINLSYNGTINGITKAEPIFGTDGLPNFVIPEPGTAALLGFGLLGLLAAGRRIVR